MLRSLNPHDLIDCQVFLVQGAGEHEATILEAIENRLENAAIGDWTHWTTTDVRLGRWPFARPVRHLIVGHRSFGDIHVLVGARGYGTSLELSLLKAMTPNLIKRRLAALMTGGDESAWSRPRGLAQEREFQSWVSVVEQCVQSAAKDLARKPRSATPPFAGGMSDGDGQVV